MLFRQTAGKLCTWSLQRCYSTASMLETISPKSMSVLQPPPTSISTLDNGVRVGSENLGGSLCTIGVWLESGSKFENAENSGASYMLEHLMFEGTERRTGKELAKELGKLTTYTDAYTTRDRMALFATCEPKNVDQVLGLLAEMTIQPNLEQANVEKARKHVLRELTMLDNDPIHILDHYLHSVAYQKTPLENPTKGRYHTVVDMNQETVANFHSNNNVIASRVSVAGAGNIDHDQLAEAAQKHFGSLGNDYTGEIPPLAPFRYTGGYTYHREDSWPYNYAMMGIEGPGYDNLHDFVAMSIAKTFMGYWDRAQENSDFSRFRLPKRVGWFEKTRLYDSFYYPYYGTGLWGNYFICKDTSASKLEKEIATEWKYLCTLVSKEELERGKEMYKASLLKTMETTPSVADDIGRQLLQYGRRVSVPELCAIADHMKPEILQETCYHYIYDRCPVVVGFGKCGELAFEGYWFYRWRMYHWFR